jgi:hypothetical protein
MKYETYRYLWPPRPETKIAPAFIGEVEKAKWWAQAKVNGTNTMLYVSPGGETLAVGRHGPENILQWQPGQQWRNFLASLPHGHWYVFQGELLHSKVKGGPRDTIVLFDVLVDRGEYLIGTTYRERYLRLQELCDHAKPGFVTQPGAINIILPGVWLVNNLTGNMRGWFDDLGKGIDYIEGLVFKDPNAKLAPCSRASANTHGMSKSRYAKANLAF